MREQLHIPDGKYRVPMIGPQERFGHYEEAGFYVKDGELGFRSVLQGENLTLREAFKDLRAYNLVDTIVRHQFHHLDTRQLSLPERFETRDGAGRMDRLTTLVESAALIAKLGGTLEQVAQIMMSDINVTVDSHRIGDHLEGDYETESTRDDDIVDYSYKSGLHDALVRRKVIDINGKLAGSPVNLYQLSNPNNPRRYDIAECPRPDGNGDRTPFTLIEGVYLTELVNIVEAARALIRVEVPGDDGNTEERLGYNNSEAARLTYQLAVRHSTEHWGELLHRAIIEIVSVADKHRFLNGSNEFRPVDYARTSESEWYRGGEQNQFISNVYAVAEKLSRVIKTAMMPIQAGYDRYEGPLELPGFEHTFVDDKLKPLVTLERKSKYSSKGILTIQAPEHKRRKAIDSWVADTTGMNRISRIEPDLIDYEIEQTRWLGSGIVKITLDWNEVADLKQGIDEVNKVWHSSTTQKPKPLQRKAMPKNVLTPQIDRARDAVIKAAWRPDFRS